MCEDSAFVPITYNGPVGMHLVYSPLRKVVNYQMHTRGDVFCVHRDDQATLPDLFVLRQGPASAPAPEPEPEAAPEPARSLAPEPEPEPEPDEAASDPKPVSDDGAKAHHAKKSKRDKKEREDEE